MPRKTFKRKNVNSKHKKSLKLNSKRSFCSKKMRTSVRKMEGGGIINDNNRKYFKITDEDVVYINNVNSFVKVYNTKTNKICEFIDNNNSYFNLNNPKVFENFNKAINEKDKTKRDIFLDLVYNERKTQIEQENLIKLPNGVFLRTPLLKGKNINCNNSKFNNSKFILQYFEIKDELLYLYKIVSILQLKDIYEIGLTSKYGGIGGLLRSIEMQQYDRGKMYVRASKSKTDFFIGEIPLSVLIIVKIPVEMSYDINLASDFDKFGSNDIYFVGSIPSKFIKIIVDNTEYDLTLENINLAITKLKKYHIIELQTEIIESITPEIIQNLTPEQITYFKPEQIEYFIPEQIQSLTPEQIQSLTLEQIQSFKPEQIQSFKPEQIQSFKPEQIQSFTPEQIQSLTQEQKQKFSTEQKILLDIYNFETN